MWAAVQAKSEPSKAGPRKAYDASCGVKENCGGAAELIGTGEGEEGQLASNDKRRRGPGTRKHRRSSVMFRDCDCSLILPTVETFPFLSLLGISGD
jgi:hypothetical protein